MGILDSKQGALGINFILSCKNCYTVLGSSSVPQKTEMLCGPCGEKRVETRTAEEIALQKERSRKDFTNRILAQVGYTYKI